MVEVGVPFLADAEQAKVDQPDHAGHNPVAGQAAVPQVLRGGRPQSGQRAGEPEHVPELLGVALLPPELVVEVLRRPLLSVPVAWIWPSGSGAIQTSAQAGGIRSARIRSSVAASVICVGGLVEYRKPYPSLTRVMPGPCVSLRTRPGTAASDEASALMRTQGKRRNVDADHG